MTKVYLVKAQYRYKDGWVNASTKQIEVFTNRKLAEAYAEYWNLRAEKWNKEMMGEWRYKVQENRICDIDYREDLLKEQIKKLPF